MEFDPNAMNFGPARQLEKKLEPANTVVLERQVEHVKAPESVKILKANLKQHHAQARIARFKQMYLGIESEATPYRLMQALALVKKVYTAPDAPTDLAAMNVLQPILQGLSPRWNALKSEAAKCPVLPGDYKYLDKLRQPHATLLTPERSALFKLLHKVYQEIEAHYKQESEAIEPPVSPAAATPATLLGLRSRLHRTTSDTEKRRLQAEILQIEQAQRNHVHQQCIKAMTKHQQNLSAVYSLAKTPRRQILAALSQLEQQWQANPINQADHPAVPNILQQASRQIARIGMSDAREFVTAQRRLIQQRIQALSDASMLALLQAWSKAFDAAIDRLLQYQATVEEEKKLQTARQDLKVLREKVEQWPSHASEVKALEKRFLALDNLDTFDADTVKERTEIRALLLQHYRQLLSGLPPIT